MLSKVLLVVVAAVSVTVASAVPAESSGHYDPAVRYGQTSTNGMDFYCLAGANSEWSQGVVVCGGSGLPPHSGFQVFPYDPATGPPLATVPAFAPNGPWTFRADNLPAWAGHAFQDGNFHIRGLGLAGETIATVNLSNGDRAGIRS